MRHGRLKMPARLGLMCGLCALGFGQIAAQTGDGQAGSAVVETQAGPLSVGGITADLVSPSDPTQRYAIFLPGAYSADRAWPVLFVMDPRGRALNPLGRLEAAAERFGYVVISSYNTQSDGGTEPNETAVAAMVGDIQEFVSVDTRRLYFSGFSGTARLSWVFGDGLSEYTAGVIGFGAGLPHDSWLMQLLLRAEPPFAFYGGAGDLDFNFEELVQLDWNLDSKGLPHRVDFYEGPHSWPGPEVFERALEWMELQAIKSGLREADPVLIEELLAKRQAQAREFEAEGKLHAAALSYRAIVTDFEGLGDVGEAPDRAEELTRGRAFRDREKALRSEIEERNRFEGDVAVLLNGLRESGQPLDVNDAVRSLNINKLIERAGKANEAQGKAKEDGQAAWRMLASLFAFTSFYEPRQYMADGRFDIAVTLYQLADIINPGTPQVCLGKGRAHAQLGGFDEAFEALGCALDNGVQGQVFESDGLLEPLHADARWVEFLARTR